MCLLKNEHLRAMENYDFANTSLSIVNLLGEDFKVILQNDISHLE